MGLSPQIRAEKVTLEQFVFLTKQLCDSLTHTSLMKEIYVSTDVETDGPIPGPHSMLSFGSAAYLADKTLVGTFTANLETLPGATGAPDTMAWWQSQPEAWAACRRDLQPPEPAMRKYLAWLKQFRLGKPVFVAYPAGFDFSFCLLVSHPLRGREPVLAFGAGHQDLCDGPPEMRLSRWPPSATCQRAGLMTCPTTTSRSTMPLNKARFSATCWRKTPA